MKFYRNTIEILSKFYRNCIEIQSNSIENVKKYCMWWKIGPRWHKIAEVMHVLGALVRSQAAECSFSRARARKKKSRPITALHRGAAEEPPRSRQGDFKEHTFGSNGPRDAQERVEGTKRTARDMGRGMMTGSHTPWAQGPANWRSYCQVFYLR